MKTLRAIAAALLFVLAAPEAGAQREYHNSDGPYRGLNCAPNETIVPILGGVKCQLLPQCKPNETLMPGPDGLACQAVKSAAASGTPGDGDHPTGAIPAVHAEIDGLRFFEGAQTPTTRHYDDIFFYNAARYVFWELELDHPAPARTTPFAVEDVWYYPSGDVAYRATENFSIQPGWTVSSFYGGARLVGTTTVAINDPAYQECIDAQLRIANSGGIGSPCSSTTDVDIHNWPVGTYTVEIRVDGKVAATGTFAMLAKNEVYAEAERTEADRSPATNAIASLNATVKSLRVFASGASFPDKSQRGYATQFQAGTARDIAWELDLAHPAPKRWVPLRIEAILSLRDARGEHAVQRRILDDAVPADWDDTWHTGALGWEDEYYYDRTGATTPTPGRWLAGTYDLDLFVEEVKIAHASFELR